MKDYIYPIFRGLSRFTGNPLGQRLLENAVLAGQYMQGIGAGGNVEYSGERAIFDRIARSGGMQLCIFDVGANCGQFLKAAMKGLQNRAARFHCFEPGTTAFSLLCKAAAELPEVTLNHFALGKETGQKPLFMDVEASVYASLTKQNLAHVGIVMERSEMVEVRTLDEYCQREGIERIDLLKMDVEGHELDVLEGSSTMFRRSAIEFVLFEFGNANVDTRTFMKDYFAFFRDHGMQIARITPSGYCHQLPKYKEALEQFRVHNYLCYKG